MTSIGSGGTPTYTARYDAAGNMTCRAPDATTTCAGTPTGAQLAFDPEGRLAGWSGGTTTDSFLYDGAGNRVEQQTILHGSFTTTTTYVAGGQEEIANNGSTTTLTKYFPSASGLPTAERVGTGGALTYLATDGQASVSAALDGSGTVTFQQLYTPYGAVRYSSGSSPTPLGYTGQQADAATGLDYYHARYYDPVAQQFASADTANDGLSRYAYTGGNPTTYVDPSGHMYVRPTGGGGPTPPTNPPPPTSCQATHDCGGGGDDCSHPTSSNYSACYSQWKLDNQNFRLGALAEEAKLWNRLMLAGLVVNLVADAVILMTNNSAISDLAAVLDFCLNAIELAPYVQGALGNTDPNLTAALDFVSGYVHEVLGTVRLALAFMKQWGSMGKAAADAAVVTLKAGIAGLGLPAIVEMTITLLAGTIGNALLNAAGQYLIGLGEQTKSDYDFQMGQDIGVWCSEHRGCTKPPVDPNTTN